MANSSEDKYTRRYFIKLTGYSLVGSFMALWYLLSAKQLKLSGGDNFKKVNFSGKADGVYFFDNFLVTKKGAALTVLSNRCTHAGCKINREYKGELVCACHGSTYDNTGKVLKGPALKPLEKLVYSIDNTGDIIIEN